MVVISMVNGYWSSEHVHWKPREGGVEGIWKSLQTSSRVDCIPVGSCNFLEKGVGRCSPWKESLC